MWGERTLALSRFANARLDDLDEQFEGIAGEYLLAWRQEPSTGLVIAGPYGVGKSYAAAAIINEIRKTGRHDCVFVTSPKIYDLYGDISRREHWDEHRDQPMWVTLEDAAVMVWNDLGKENRTGGFQDQVIYCFSRLLRERVEKGRSTVFTTNLRLTPGKHTDMVRSVYGEGFWSLLHEAAPLRFEVTDMVDRRKT